MKPENPDQTFQHLMGWARTSLLKFPGKESRSAFGHSVGVSQLSRKMDLAAEFNRMSSVSNGEGLVLVENRKHITVVLAERSAHATHTLALQHQQVSRRTRLVSHLILRTKVPEGSPSRGRSCLHALGYSAGSRGRGQIGMGFADIPMGPWRREPPRLLTVTQSPSSGCGLKETAP